MGNTTAAASPAGKPTARPGTTDAKAKTTSVLARLRTRVGLGLAAGAAALIGPIALAPAAHADKFMEPPVSGATQPFTNHGYERTCTFGGSGYILMRAKVEEYINPPGSPSWVAVKGLQLFNRYNADTVMSVRYQRLEDDKASYNHDGVVTSIAQNGQGRPDWFGTGQSTDFYAWNTGSTFSRFRDDRVEYIINFTFPHVSGDTQYTCRLPIIDQHKVY